MGITKEQLVDALSQTKEYVDNKSVSISSDANNAVTDSNGLFVKDLSGEINKINIAQKTVNKPSSVSLIADDVYTFTLNAASTIGKSEATILNQTLKLKQSIKDFDYIEFALTPKTDARVRPSQLTRLRTKDIIYNDSETVEQMGSLFTFSFKLESAESGAYGSGDIVVAAWFKDDTTLLVFTANTPFTAANWGGTYQIDLYGVNSETIVIDPLEYVNESSGIEDTPVGHIIAHMGTTAPKHYLACDGSVYNILDYPYLAEHIKTEFGSYNYFGGDGVDTFAVVDLRGEFLRGTGTNSHDNQGNGGEVGEHQDATEQTQAYGIATNDGGGSIAWLATASLNEIPNVDSAYGSGQLVGVNTTSTAKSAKAYTSRPTNTSVLYCIKYEPCYYMQNTYNGNVYSTDEQIVGKWIDGKPIYQKVVETKTATTTETVENIYSLESNCEIIQLDGWFTATSNDGRGNLNFYLEGNYIATWSSNSHDPNKVYCETNAYNNIPCTLILKYTKTTD